MTLWPKITLAAILLLPLTLLCQDCQPQIEEMSRKQLVSFLTEKAHNSSPECLTRAIVRVSELRPPAQEATAALISLIDFRRPATEAEKVGIGSSTRDPYPAVAALIGVGLPAVAPLIESLKHIDLSEISRQNTLRTLISIHASNPPEAISDLKRAAANADDPDASQRLERDAKDALRYCVGSWRGPCEAAETEPTS